MMRDKYMPSFRFRLARGLAIGGVLGAALVASVAGTSYGRATVGAFHFESPPSSETITNFPCSEGIPVTMTARVTSDGHFTEVDSRHFNVRGTDTIDYRVDFGDGRYAIGQVVEHFGFRLNMNRPRTTETGTQQEQATVYAADGQPIGTFTVHVTIHVTYADVNGNFEPDPDEITVSFDRTRVRCS
ncbi:MAG: hypothetical protein ABW142_01290 [Thermoleophilaceae bacterium]|jgi:hypothetical protein